jgi:DNA-binding CsgD family transcriptional regulator
MSVREPLALVGREDECARIAELLAAAFEQRSGVLVVSGEPGIGKSALCAWAVEQAAGMRMLSVTGVECEADLPFAGLASLCGPELARVATLPEPQARALDAALARTDSAPVDRLSIGAAVLSLLAAAAPAAPLLVLVDDAQWLDEASAHALRFAARRLSVEGIAMLIATRPGSAFELDGGGLPTLAVEPLDDVAGRRLLAAEHGSLAAPVVEVLLAHSAGNPLALIEAPRALSDAQRTGAEAVQSPIAIGDALAAALLLRVAPLPARTRRALLVASATTSSRVAPVLAALKELGLDPSALEPAERAGVIAIDAERFEMRHPLLRSAIYRDADGPSRRAVHAVLSRVTDDDERAWHLGQSAVGEDETAAAELEAAGVRARARGALAAASAALAFAARLSPPGADRTRRLTQAARDAHVAGHPAAAERLLDTALGEEPDPLTRAEIQHLRGRILVLQGRTVEASELLVAEAARVRGAAPAQAAAMLAEACLESMISADVGRAIALARDACAIAPTGDPETVVFASTMLAGALVLEGNREEASKLLDRVLPALRAADPLTEAGQLVSFAAQCHFWLERDDVAAELLNAATSTARRNSAPAALLLPLTCHGELELRRGRWTAAAAEFEEAADLSAELAESVYAAYPLECLARLTAATGEEWRCRDYAARAMRLVARHHNEFGRLYIHSALGLLELGLGRPDAAVEALEQAAELAARSGLGEPNIVHWQPDLIEAYAFSGRRAAALATLAELERHAQKTHGLWVGGTLARCRGLLADPDEALAHFRESAELLEAANAPFDLARTHLYRGEQARRAGRRREARIDLQAAADCFDALGAEPWSSRAYAELRASGVSRRRKADHATHVELTAHELRVARIVAEGASNREAAAALFLSPKTVEYHLASIYRKLGVHRRAELAAVATARGWLEPSAALHVPLGEPAA